MTKRPFIKIAFFLLGLSNSFLFFVGVFPGSHTQASCPRRAQNYNGWRKNRVVSYKAIGFTPQELDYMQGGGAMGNWTANNIPYGGNCSNVQFVETTILQDIRDRVKCCGNKFRASLTPSWLFLR